MLCGLISKAETSALQCEGENGAAKEQNTALCAMNTFSFRNCGRKFLGMVQ